MIRRYITGLTTEYIPADVTGPVDLTGNNPFFAFMAQRVKPGDSDWLTGVWDGASTVDSRGEYTMTAMYLLNAGALADGRWEVWVKVAGSPEAPVRHVGSLFVGE